MIDNAVLGGGFITLRPYAVQDIELLHAAVVESLTALAPYMDFAHHGYSVEESKTWVSRRSREWKDGSAYDFAIVDAQNGKYLGGCGINRFDERRNVANLGYWVRTGCTGRGVATAAARLLSRFGVEQLGLKRIGLQIALPNRASQRVAEKSGATREGVLRNGMFVRNLIYDCVLYSFIPRDFGIRG